MENSTTQNKSNMEITNEQLAKFGVLFAVLYLTEMNIKVKKPMVQQMYDGLLTDVVDNFQQINVVEKSYDDLLKILK